MVQFIAATGLSFINGGASIVGGCGSGLGADCISNALVSLILIILTILFLAFLLVLGYAAQERRSSRLAQVLIAAEAVAALVYLFDTKHSQGILDRATNFAALLLALWVIVLAWRLARARGGRIVKSQSRRRSNASR